MKFTLFLTHGFIVPIPVKGTNQMQFIRVLFVRLYSHSSYSFVAKVRVSLLSFPNGILNLLSKKQSEILRKLQVSHNVHLHKLIVSLSSFFTKLCPFLFWFHPLLFKTLSLPTLGNVRTFFVVEVIKNISIALRLLLS